MSNTITSATPQTSGGSIDRLAATAGLAEARPDDTKVSVVTVVLNGASTLEHTLQSVTNQTHPAVEYIVIDGGSNDGSLELIQQYAGRIAHWKSAPDQGIYDAMNKGLNVATGDWIIFVGADDFLTGPRVLEQFMKHAHRHVDVLFGDVILSNGRRFRSRFDRRLLLHNCLHHQGAFYRRNLFDGYRYPTELRILADYHLNLQLHRDGRRGLYIPHAVSYCNLGGASSSPQFREQALSELRQIRSEHVSKPIGTCLQAVMRVRELARRIGY